MPDTTTFFEQGFALVIGVGDDLPSTVRDANAITALLKDQQKAAYRPENVLSLIAKNASHDRILAALDTLKQKVQASADGGANATLVVYYSGHGVRKASGSGHEYFFVPNNYANEGKLVSGEVFMDKVSAIPAKRSLILIDSCYAGGFSMPKAAPAPNIEATQGDIVKGLSRGQGQVIVASSTDDQLSLSKSNAYGLFTEAVLEVLGGKEMNEAASFVTAIDLIQYLEKEVPKKAQKYNFTQEPTVNINNYTSFYICKNAYFKEEEEAKVPKIFTLYAPIDGKYNDLLQRVLNNYVNTEKIQSWDPDKILPGMNIEDVINENLQDSQLVIPLVSTDYLNNDLCKKVHLQAKNLGKIISPIIVNYSLYDLYTDLFPENLKLEPLKDGEVLPLEDWENKDKALSKAVRKIIQNVRSK